MSIGMFGVELLGIFCHASKNLATFLIAVAAVNVEPLLEQYSQFVTCL